MPATGGLVVASREGAPPDSLAGHDLARIDPRRKNQLSINLKANTIRTSLDIPHWRRTGFMNGEGGAVGKGLFEVQLISQKCQRDLVASLYVVMLLDSGSPDIKRWNTIDWRSV